MKISNISHLLYFIKFCLALELLIENIYVLCAQQQHFKLKAYSMNYSINFKFNERNEGVKYHIIKNSKLIVLLNID